jgi:predicted metalloprotease with PDZ domain
LFIASVDVESPAWNAGLRMRQQLLQINGIKATTQLLIESMDKTMPGDKITIEVFTNNSTKEMEVIFGRKKQRNFTISPVESPAPLQKQILESWLNG